MPSQESVLNPEVGAGLALVFVLAAMLAVIHLFAGHLQVFDRIPRSRWLSFGSGISVAYVFVHLLPELEEGEWPLRRAIFS